MKWVKDKTGRFPERPFYDEEELDYECESLVASFLSGRYGGVTFPISTNDLTILVERETSQLDLFADLSGEGVDVEGVTDFLPDKKPRVRISQEFQADARRDNRLRTTLTHELGHVKFHAFLWPQGQGSLFPVAVHQNSPRCKREKILHADSVDWLEWQAGYASGAYLIPITPLQAIVRATLSRGRLSAVTAISPEGRHLIKEVQKAFQVSGEAAEVRLSQRRFITGYTPTRSMF